MTQGAHLYNSNGGPWQPGQKQFCGEQLAPPRPNFSYFQPMDVALAKVGPGYTVVTG